MYAQTLTRTVMALFIASIVDAFKAIFDQASKSDRTIVMSATDMNIVTDNEQTVTISDQPAEVIGEAFEIDPTSKISIRSYLEQLCDYSLVNPNRINKIKAIIGSRSAEQMTVAQINKWLADELVKVNDQVTSFDGSAKSFLEVINNSTLDKAFAGATLVHVAVPSNDQIAINHNGAGTVNFMGATVVDVVTYLTFPTVNKAGIPVQVTKNYDLAKSGWKWTALVRGTQQYDAVLDSLKEGALKLSPFGLTRMTTARIDSSYAILLIQRARLESQGRSTRIVDQLMTSYIEAKCNIDRFLDGNLVGQPQPFYDFGTDNQGNTGGRGNSGYGSHQS